jgi:hypothetical protein
MSTSRRFLQGQAGKQAVFGTFVVPDFQLPFTGRYVDAGDFHEAELDAGRLWPVAIVNRVSHHATFTLNGAAFFEMMPVFFNAGLDDDAAPTGSDPYTYVYSPSLTTGGEAIPYTFMFGGGENIGATGPAVRIQDSYCQQIVLTGNLNSRDVQISSNWFGSSVNANNFAGHNFITGIGMPPNLNMLRFPFASLEYDDATLTGGIFSGMTAFECKLMDWTLTINTGLTPQWAADANSLTMCGAFIGTPSVEFAATLRTTEDTFQAIVANANGESPTYEELMFTLTGADGRSAVFRMTGRWMPVSSAHEVSGEEVVMNATFNAGGYPSQTTTPHAFDATFITKWNHT